MIVKTTSPRGNKEISIIKLYRNNLSVPEIAKKLRLSWTNIYKILKQNNVPRRTPALQNKIRFERQPLTFKYQPPLTQKQRDLYIAGLMLYLGEGAKNGNTIDFANSDPRLLKIFIKFLREIFEINEEKLRFYLYCFSNQNTGTLLSFWGKELQIKISQFTKPYIRQSESKKTRIMQYGVLHIRYHDKRLLEKILSLCSDLIASINWAGSEVAKRGRLS